MRLWGITIFLFSSSVAFCQRPKSGVWLSLQLPISISQKWQWHNDAGYRTLGVSSEPLQYLYRTGVRYSFNKRWSAASGVAFFFSRTSFSKSNDEFGHEFRLWEEVNYQHPVSDKLQWQLRLRTEQRFFETTTIKPKYAAYRFRLRSGITKKINNKWSLQLADEYMQQQTRQELSFDQNRLMVSGIYNLNPATQLQGGYMWLLWPHEEQHILTIGFIKKFSLHAG